MFSQYFTIVFRHEIRTYDSSPNNASEYLMALIVDPSVTNYKTQLPLNCLLI